MRTVSPPSVLLDHLARARRDGLDLDTAWPAAVLAATSGLLVSEQEQWRSAFTSTREAWTAAYARERAAAAPLRALTLLAEDRDAPDDAGEPCAHCSGPLPAGSDPRRSYCSARCRNRAHAARERALAA